LGLNLCTETISNGVFCGDNAAPCCPGDTCIHPDVGICGDITTTVCDVCNDGNQICGDGLVCNTDNSPGSVTLENFSGGEQSFQLTLNTGICVPSDENSIACSADAECPDCLRCCGGECIRVSGDRTTLCGDSRGPCCKTEDECCNNECVPAGDSAQVDSDDEGEFLFAGLKNDAIKKDDGNTEDVHPKHMVLSLDVPMLWLVSAVCILISVTALMCYCYNRPPKAQRVDSLSNV